MLDDTRLLIFFGDSSQDTTSAFDELLAARREGTLLHRFLAGSHLAIQEECLKLPLLARTGFQGLSEINRLFRENRNNGDFHPALQSAELVMLQLGSLLSAYEKNPGARFPDASNDVVIGVCLGELSAAALSLAAGIIDLVPLAIQAVRLAFRTGAEAERAAQRLHTSNGGHQSWSVAIPRDSPLASSKVLAETQSAKNIPVRNRVYISAYGRNTVTLSGPPPSLANILRDRPSKSFDLPIRAPFHADHIHNEQTISSLLDVHAIREVYKDSQLGTCKQNFVSGSNGLHREATTRLHVFEQALTAILLSPLDWKQMRDGCYKAMEDSNNGAWTLRAFGPAFSLEHLVSSLTSDGKFCIDIDHNFGQYTHTSRTDRAPLAIVGMAGRFPQADSVEQLWQILMQGRDCHAKIPTDRFDPDTHLSEPAFGCFLNAPGAFDARFFNVSPREALQMEPGQRLSLVTAYEALEMAGYVPNRTVSTQLGRIGTFYGQTVDEYKEQNMPQEVGTHFIPGSLRAFGPGRINRHFKFGGPASNIDTACSSSAVALHTACTAIWNSECDMAVAGGANILSSSDNYTGLSAGYFLSRTGGCKTFDDDADGYCRAEAVVSVVIKRLDAAEADNDNILGVILSAASNYSADSVSLTHPHAPTQQLLYQQVISQAGLQPFDIDYVEMHGTGTQAGDACEMNSVTSVFAPAAPTESRDDPLFVSAVKANIGHSEAASGVASLVKALLVLKHETLPPHIGIQNKINRNFQDLSERNVCIPLQATSLPTKTDSGDRRRVLVNNFGAAGGNTAIVLEEYPKKQRAGLHDERAYHIINVTAKTDRSLRANVQSLLQYLQDTPDVSLSDLSYTTTARRVHHSLRISSVCSSVSELKNSLKTAASHTNSSQLTMASGLIFAFTGQGAFYQPLGRDLYNSFSGFRNLINQLDDVAQSYGFPSIISVIDDSEEHTGDLSPVQVHLTLLIVQIGLTDFLALLGVQPGVVIGHSLGEYGAMYASRILTASDAIYLVGKRAELLEKHCIKGARTMMTVKASRDMISKYLKSFEVDLACINTPNDTVISGDPLVIEEAQQKLTSCGVRSTILELPFGFHSSHVDPILEQLEMLAGSVNFGTPTVPLLSTLLGEVVRQPGVINSSYIRRQTREMVNFVDAISSAQEGGLIDPASTWIEIGPHPLCISMARATLNESIIEIPILRKGESSTQSLAKALAKLTSRGMDIDWMQYHHDYESSQSLLVLPGYNFEEKNYWIEYENDWMLSKGKSVPSQLQQSQERGPCTTSVQRLLSHEDGPDGTIDLLFESDLSDPDLHSAIIGHSVNGSGLCPASIYGDVALTIANYIFGPHGFESLESGIDISEMVITNAIVVPRERPTIPAFMRIAATADISAGRLTIKFGRLDTESDTTQWCASCIVTTGHGQDWRSVWSKTDYLIHGRLKALEQGTIHGETHKIFRGMVYRMFASCVDYDSKYRAMQEVLLNSEDLEAAARLNLYAGANGGRYFCSPFWIDALLHLAGFVMNANDAVDTQNSVYISGGWGSMRFAQTLDPNLPYRLHVKMLPSGKGAVEGEVTVLQGRDIVAKVSDLKFQEVPHALLNVIIPSVQPSAKMQSRKDSVPQAPLRESREKQQNRGVEAFFEILATQAGITVEELWEIDVFDEMGVDSLLSLQIMAIAEEQLGWQLAHNLFQDYPTARSLRAHLQQLTDEVDDDQNSCSDSETVNSDGSTQPSSVVEDRTTMLHALIAQHLGVEIRELFDAPSLTELGLDSLMGLNIIGDLQAQFGVRIAPHALSGKVTLTDLQQLVGIEASAPNTRPDTPACITAGKKGRIAPSQPTLSRVLHEPTTSNATIFLFPDGSGSPAIYAKLQAPAKTRVVALQSPYLAQPQDFEVSIPTLVEKWVAEIRQQQPCGPYILAGYSAGGYYAFEATHQLLSANQEVEQLLLIDSPCRTRYEAMPAELPQWLAQQGILPQAHDTVTAHFEATIRAIKAYEPSPLPPGAAPSVTILWASEGACPTLKSALLPPSVDMAGLTEWLLQRPSDALTGMGGWQELLPSRHIVTRTIGGHHFNVLRKGASAILTLS